MGGKAFQADGLFTPRMPPNIYDRTLKEVLVKLQTIYSQVESTIEAPGKLDYGDVDILVVPGNNVPSDQDVATLLGAQHVKRIRNSPTAHFAIPWPESVMSHDGNVTATSNAVGSGPYSKNRSNEDLDERFESIHLAEARQNREMHEELSIQLRYIQVDVHVCKDVADLKILSFSHAHGDFYMILGGILRRFGISLSDSGLYIRIAELETWNKNEARVRLLNDPDEILKYLGLEVARFWQPFTSWDDAMTYIASCRFHDPAKGKKDDLSQDPADFKALDRIRLLKRPMFAYWIETYLPTHRDDPAGSAAGMTREQVIEEAKCLFGRDFTERFDFQRSNGMQKMGVQRLWADIRHDVTAIGSELTYAMKGLKREITQTSGENCMLIDVQKDYAAGRYDQVKEWAAQNWREVGIRQEELDRLKSGQKYREKLEKEGKLAKREQSHD